MYSFFLNMQALPFPTHTCGKYYSCEYLSIHMRAANDLGRQLYFPIQTRSFSVFEEPERDVGSSSQDNNRPIADTFPCTTATKVAGERKRFALSSAAEIGKPVTVERDYSVN